MMSSINILSVLQGDGDRECEYTLNCGWMHMKFKGSKTAMPIIEVAARRWTHRGRVNKDIA